MKPKKYTTALFLAVASLPCLALPSGLASSTATQMQKRIQADSEAQKYFNRLAQMKQEAFCATELPKLRGGAISSTSKDALMLASMSFGLLDEDFEAVANKSVRVGLASCAVLASWGKPIRINTTHNQDARMEQWVYGSRTYLYVSDGRVKAAQTSR